MTMSGRKGGARGTCSVCKAPGHYKSTCPMREPEELAAERSAKGIYRRPLSVIRAALQEADGNTRRAGAILRVTHQRVGQYIHAHNLWEWVEELRAAVRPSPEEVAENRRAVSREAAIRSRENRAKGLCACGRRPRVVVENGAHVKRANCARCFKNQKKGDKATRARRLKRGECPRCGGTPDHPLKHCRDCLDYAQDLHKKA